MGTLTIALVLLVVLFVLLLGGVWIAIALGAVAFIGLAFFTSILTSLASTGSAR